MRILAIDFGKKRIGLALSDPLGFTAQPYDVIANDKMMFARIGAVISEKEVSKIIVGLPVSLDGKLGISADDVLKFVEKLRSAVKIPVETIDERMTTAQAQKILIDADVRRDKRKDVIDKMAAALMLKTYMDRMKSGSGRGNEEER